MRSIATEQGDSLTRLARQVAAQRAKPGFAMDAYFHRSELVYRKELDEILYKSWLYAGHVSQLANPGDYFLFDLGEDSIILARAEDGAIHALMNICRHRGSRLCEAAQGNRKAFACPYHGWVYNLDGSLKAARDMAAKAGFDPANYGLKKAQCLVFEGLIFINADPAAVAAALRRLAPPSPGAAPLRPARRQDRPPPSLSGRRQLEAGAGLVRARRRRGGPGLRPRRPHLAMGPHLSWRTSTSSSATAKA